MKKVMIYFFLIVLLTAFGTSCRNSSVAGDRDEASLSGENSGTAGQDRAIEGKRRHQARQQGQSNHGGKNAGNDSIRRWSSGDEIPLSEEEKNAIELQTASVEQRPLRSKLQVMGKVISHPQRKAIVSYAFPARISKIHINIGDWVEEGQELVTLQSEEVGNARSEYYKAKADHNLALVNFEREKNLFERGVGAKKDYLAGEAELKVADANLDAAEKKLHVLGFTEAQVKTIAETHQISPIITLFAPLKGKIIMNNAILGAMVDQETEILVIMDPSLLCVDAEIYEKDISKVRTGQKVEISVPAYPGESFVGNICFVGDVLNEETRTITVRAEVNNKDFKLKPGMFADISIYLNHETETLVVPFEAVLDEKEDKIVFVKEGSKYTLRLVKTGIREAGYLEILQGLKIGEVVVTKGNYQLKSKLYDEILKKGHIH
ncbi:MAG: efflux RND transporter periplasmic adaptor subunit [Candidatus Aminicenantes bacterium]|nr:efflux RND transporter periplasmic adaptor subunit [Candidatus Aminicenantes bacterium]